MNWLIGHLVGDYLAQNDWMALNKKKNSWACAAHVAAYTFIVLLFTWWPWWTYLIIAGTHFLQDRTQFIPWLMKKLKQEQFAKPPLAPWSVIVVDNILHLVVLFFLSLAVG